MNLTGILIVQLGTPDEPTGPALRRYLKQFLSDPRLIELPKLLWWPILNLIILNTRPKQSAKKYARVWDEKTGSPLMHYTQMQTKLLQEKFPGIPVEFGMQIGNPALLETIKKMVAQGIEKIIVFPMYPQYSATTTASAMDCLGQALQKIRRVPAIRFIPPYYQHPAYIKALATIIREQEAKLSWKPDHHLISFHGIPISYCQRGDVYATHVKRTTFALVKEMGWSRDYWTQSFQSLFGREEWLKPYTEETLIKMAKKGIKKVFVSTPGFTADCLETIDEIGHEAKEVFVEAGGEELFQCPCLNDHPAWIEAMKTIVEEEGAGWLQSR